MGPLHRSRPGARPRRSDAFKAIVVVEAQDLTRVGLEFVAATSRSDTDLGDMAVLVPNNRLVRDYAKIIAGLGLACRALDKYEELFVAMTRARHTVWVGRGWEPSRLLGSP